MMPEQDHGNFIAPLALRFAGGEISPRRLVLLAAVGQRGSINAAAKQVGMTYKAAWDAVEAMNNLAGERLVESRQGGSGGGGATLTVEGQRVVDAYQRLEVLQAGFLQNFAMHPQDGELYDVIRRINMRTSARNALHGTVVEVREGAVNAEVMLALAGGEPLYAVVTMASVRDMGLRPGLSAWALIKASWVILAAPDISMKISARNRLCGHITRIEHGAVNAEVVLELAGGATLAAIITEPSVTALEFAVGDQACALIKATHVIVGVD